MRIIIEEHKYAAADVKDILKGIDALENVEGYVSVNYVGRCPHECSQSKGLGYYHTKKMFRRNHIGI